MTKKRFSTLWMAFALITFLVLVLTVVCAVGLFFFFFEKKYFDNVSHNSRPLFLLVFLLLLSLAEGIILFLFVGKIILNPIRQFSEATKKVATGDFSIQITDTSKINEIQDMKNNFNGMVQELSSIETLRTDFVVNVSHEFKTPLAAIEGYAMLLQDVDISPEEQKEYLQMIISSSKQLSALTENILRLSKLENQEVILDQKEFRLDEQIRHVILLLENKWSQKNLDIELDLEKIEYYGSESLLWQVWLNLIDNAIKFCQENGKIVIKLIVNEDNIEISIKDDGKGITNEEARHIFDKFYQVDNSRKEEGNGLGLALVKRIIDLCDGGIMVVSEKDTGAEFLVTLPKNKKV